MAISFVSLFSDQAFAGKEEEARTKLEAAHLASLKAQILGKKEVNSPNQIFNRINYLESLKLRSQQRKQLEAINEENRRLVALPADAVMHGLTYLNGPSFAQASCTSHAFATYARDPELKKQIRANNEKEALDRLLSVIGPFVTIPEGNLPSTIEGDFVQDGPFVPSFELNSYPVTRGLWMEVMKKIPDEVPANERTTWADCKKCPVNYVAYENRDLSPAEIQEFLKRLNEKTLSKNCTYDLPDDNQLWYSIRGDMTGHNQDPYSLGVTAGSVNQYVTHSGNSNGQIQSVGNKRLNAFGIELGNVWKISKSLYNQNHPEWGRSKRGGSWHDFVVRSEGRYHSLTGSLARSNETGFSLLRTCH